MTYVLDSSSFIVLGHFNPDLFPSFWENFDHLVASDRVITVREVRKEIDNHIARPSLVAWIKENSSIFLSPTAEETEFLRSVFSIERFRSLLKPSQLLRAGPAADPFLVALAHTRRACLVTEETRKNNAVRIPDVCDFYRIDCTNLDGMMKREGWRF